MIGLLTGCAATRQSADSGQLQIRVAQLESKLEERDQEIDDLKFEVKELSSQMDDVGSTPSSSSKKAQAADASSEEQVAVNLEDGEIIRVAVGAQDVQRALKNAGYYDGVIDGNIGSASKRAIKDFQKDHSLTSDGIVGKKTCTALKSYLSN